MKVKVLKLAGIALLVISLLAMPLMGACGPKLPEEGVEPIVIGLPCSFGFQWYTEMENSVNLAIEEINAAGGVDVGGVKRPFKLVTTDTRDSLPGVPTADSLLAIEKLILEEKPAAIVCAPNRSEVMLAAMDLIAKYKIPQIGSAAKSPAFQAQILENYDSYKYCFRTTTTAVYMANYHIDFIERLGEQFGFNKLFTIQEDVLWARGTAGLVAQALEGKGWEIVGSENIPLGTTDYSMALMKAKESGAEVIPMFFDMPEVSELFAQYATMKVPALPVGVVISLVDPAAWELYEGDVEGLVLHICEAGDFPVPSMPKSVEFYEAYTERWGAQPTQVAGQAPSYDAVYVLKDAIERAGTLDPDALVTALEATDIEGAIGRIRFGEDHQVPYGYDPQEGAMGLMVQWQQPGVRKTVFPLDIAEAEVVLPPWMK